jgi:hypothetical protein
VEAYTSAVLKAVMQAFFKLLDPANVADVDGIAC